VRAQLIDAAVPGVEDINILAGCLQHCRRRTHQHQRTRLGTLADFFVNLLGKLPEIRAVSVLRAGKEHRTARSDVGSDLAARLAAHPVEYGKKLIGTGVGRSAERRIGNIVDVVDGTVDISASAIIEPDVDFSKITDVFVITSFNGQGVAD
jgi:hypothetical protein